MDAASLSLKEVHMRPSGGQYAFARSSEFPAEWWHLGYGDSEEGHCVSAWRDGVEVARCKFALYADSPYESAYGPMPDGQLDILALEVAVSARRIGVGRAFLLALRDMYPAPAFTALNDDNESRKFWDAVGWRRYDSRDPMGFEAERANYSEV